MGARKNCLRRWGLPPPFVGEGQGGGRHILKLW